MLRACTTLQRSNLASHKCDGSTAASKILLRACYPIISQAHHTIDSTSVDKRLGHFLVQSETRIEKTCSRLETKKRQSYAVEKAPFQLKKKKKGLRFSNWARQSKKLRFPIQLVSRMRESELLESPAAYSYESHTPTQQHDIV